MPEHRWLYPIDWPELSKLIRFGGAKGASIAAVPTGPASFISVTGAGGMPNFVAAVWVARPPVEAWISQQEEADEAAKAGEYPELTTAVPLEPQ